MKIKEVRAAYKTLKPRAEKAASSIKAAEDKGAAHKDAAPLRKEIFSALRAICTDEQKAKLNGWLEKRRAAQKEKN